MRCTNPKMEKLVSLYQFNLLSEEEKISVQAHILECDYCFQELYRLSPAIEILEEMPERFLEALKPKEILLIKITKLLKKQFHSLKKSIHLISSAMELYWKRPVTKVLIPATAIILFVIYYFDPLSLFQPPAYSDLAILTKAPYQAIRFKGPVELAPSLELFAEGMNLYEDNKFAETVPKLTAFVAQDSNNAYGHFYLGVSFLLENSFENGIKHLTIASNLCKEQELEWLSEKCSWYLGNAYLKTDDVENALKELTQVIEFKGKFGEKAITQIKKIEEMKKKKVKN